MIAESSVCYFDQEMSYRAPSQSFYLSNFICLCWHIFLSRRRVPMAPTGSDRFTALKVLPLLRRQLPISDSGSSIWKYLCEICKDDAFLLGSTSERCSHVRQDVVPALKARDWFKLDELGGLGLRLVIYFTGLDQNTYRCLNINNEEGSTSDQNEREGEELCSYRWAHEPFDDSYPLIV